MTDPAALLCHLDIERRQVENEPISRHRDTCHLKKSVGDFSGARLKKDDGSFQCEARNRHQEKQE
jgi:hypothetical protein